MDNLWGLFNKKASPDEVAKSRADLIQEIQKVSKRCLIIYAADTGESKSHIPIPREMVIDDLGPFSDLLLCRSNNYRGVDVMIETLGGVFEVAEDMAKLLRREFDEVRFIVPNVAKSAGTILCMSGDEILMDHRSALGPIDPQFRGIRAFAAQDFLSGFDAIKAEVDEKKSLNLAYVPMLQQISPADLEACRIATKLSQEFVAEWLCKYMFRDSRDAEKKLLTAKRRRNMARRAARTLCDRSKWLSHARSVKIDDLKEIGIKVIDYTKDYGKTGANLWKLWLTCLYQFRASTTTKIFQNDKINFFEHVNVQSRRPGPTDQQAQVPKLDASTKHVNIMVECDKCGMPHHFQLNFVPNEPLTPGHEVFPAQDKFQCKNCEYNHDISGIRLQLEGNVGKKSER